MVQNTLSLLESRMEDEGRGDRENSLAALMNMEKTMSAISAIRAQGVWKALVPSALRLGK